MTKSNMAGFDWNPMDSSIFRGWLSAGEGLTLASTYLLSPSLTASLSQEMALFNTNNNIPNLPGISSLDPRLSPFAVDVMVPTANLVATAAGVIVGNYLVPGYGSALGVGVAAGMNWLEGQSGIPQSQTTYGKWASYIGGAIGVGSVLWDASKSKDTVTPSTSTPSASVDPGYNPGYGANQNPTPSASPSTLDQLKAVVADYKPYFDAAGQAYAAVKPFLGPSGGSTTPGGGSTPLMAPKTGTDATTKMSMALLFIFAVKSLQD